MGGAAFRLARVDPASRRRPVGIYTEVALDIQSDGTGIIRMQPNSFAIVEW